ncbi:MAG TPA: S-layer homology domain-containing protein [Acidimicrobiales bacterium]|nr:S-layer homology domain-containing protein [Acidimicrobiales bacterium]
MAAIAALTVGIFAVSPAGAAEPPGAVTTSDFCANAGDASMFEDIDDSTFTDEIVCAELLGMTQGTTLTTYDPDADVTRGQMASFIARMIDKASELELGEVAELPAADPDAASFSDVDDESPHADAIARLAAVDIVLGGPGALPATAYGPQLPIDRDQMASLINRAVGFMTGSPLATDQEYFTDVSPENVHAANVNALAAAGITQGIGNEMYAPDQAVTRGQMAAFLVRSFAVLAEAGVIAPPPPAANAAFAATLGELNGSGADGTATVVVEGTVATVRVDIAGASPDLVHAQHIHIGGNNECPTPANDTDGDGFISTPEGVPSYGGIAVSLTTEGDTNPASGLAIARMPVASASGDVTYERTFRLPTGLTAADVANGVIVSHGVADTTLGTDDSAYDGRDSPLAEGVPQEATLPAACGALDAPAEATSFQTALTELNGSTATGTATVLVNGNLATVTVDIAGASPGLVHAQHIHIGGNNVCPTPADDTNGDGFISTPEGVPSYGGIAVSLTTEGDTSPASGLAIARMPVASDASVVSYERSFVLPAGVTAADVEDGVIVSHGVAATTLGTDPATYDGPDSPLAEGVPQEATLPAACGALVAT